MKRTVRRMSGLLLLLLGSSLCWYPAIAQRYVQQETIQYVKRFEQMYPQQETAKETAAPAEDPLYARMQAYNLQLCAQEQVTFADPWIVAQTPAVRGLEEYSKKPFGYIQIPAMDTVLPLYIGASVSHMAKGAAVLGETSLPVGGINTNCVIAGHRGYRGIAFFRDIEKLQIGDCVQIRNPWERLTYTVEALQRIAPDDSEAVKIQKDRDMLTLLTCHPYRGNGKWRYIVYCVRSEEHMEEKEEGLAGQSKKTADTGHRSAGKDIERENLICRISGMVIAVMCLCVIKRRSKNQKNKEENV